jgi:hypothetical protein
MVIKYNENLNPVNGKLIIDQALNTTHSIIDVDTLSFLNVRFYLTDLTTQKEDDGHNVL